MIELPPWAVEMRDLFRSGSAAQFLIHGNVFDIVPHGGRMLSVPAFLDEVMFGSYDVVLRYDRSRGVRATRGAEDWGNWLDQALGREGNLPSLLREPGSALELIDRYLLRTLNLKALTAGSATSASSAPSAPSAPSLAQAFAALLAAEQGKVPPPLPINEHALREDVIEQVTRRVIERMTDSAVREVVAGIAERLVREEIARIKAGGR
jgi:hypothetical protein